MERFAWQRLPEPARTALEAEFGRVLATQTTPAGLTVGIASRVRTEHTMLFVKAVPRRSPAWPDYAREHRVNQALPESVPAPRLRWSSDAGWLTLAFDHIPGPHPDLRHHAPAIMNTLQATHTALTPSPVPDLRPITEKLTPMLLAPRNAAKEQPDAVPETPSGVGRGQGVDVHEPGPLLHQPGQAQPGGDHHQVRAGATARWRRPPNFMRESPPRTPTPTSSASLNVN